MSRVKYLEQKRRYEQYKELKRCVAEGKPLTFAQRNILNIEEKKRRQYDKRSDIR